jgi:predicted deacetylase
MFNKTLLRTILVALLFWSMGTGQNFDSLLFAIRVDDILSRNTTILPRSIVPFEEVANNRGAKVTWAVIPHRLVESTNQDGQLANELEATVVKGNEVALHGYTHICAYCGATNHEMICTSHGISFSYAQQCSLISRGLQILAQQIGLKPTTFVPPGHAADLTTYQVLLDYGFRLISTVGPQRSCIYDTLYNLAPGSDPTWALTSSQYRNKLDQTLQSIDQQFQQNDFYCLLCHDYFIRAGYESGIVLDWTAELLDSLRSRYGNRLKFVTLSEAADTYRAPTLVSDKQRQIAINYQPQNFPNPFNLTTNIQWILPRSSEITITVYNILGKEIQTLPLGWLSAGFHRVQFDGTSLPSGMYFYQVVSGHNSQSAKMLLLK